MSWKQSLAFYPREELKDYFKLWQNWEPKEI